MKLPDLRDAAELAVGVSTMLSQTARLPYQPDRSAAISAADDRLSSDDVPQVVSGAHELAGAFLLASGDFVHAVRGLLLQEFDLVYSTASLARSAAEYAAKSWWLLEPGIDFDEQACRVVAAFRSALDDEERLSGMAVDLDEPRRGFDRWEQATGLAAKKGLPPTLQLLTRMAPVDGELHWRNLSGTVHGGAFAVLRAHQSVLRGQPLHQYEQLVQGDRRRRLRPPGDLCSDCGGRIRP